MGTSTRLSRMPALDGLRGLAVIGVIAFHAGHLRGGYLGVDAFFVLSGFLITSLLLAEREGTGAVGLGAFWTRRARRLLPALFLLLAVVAVSSIAWATLGEAQRLRADGLATMFYVANWHAIVAGQGYWAAYETPSPLQHTWSLSIEEQFYVVWPLLVVGLAWVAARRGADLRRTVLVAAVTGTVVSFGLMLALYVPGAEPTRVYFGTDTRASAILLGAALAALTGRPGRPVPARTPLWLECAGWLAVAWLVWAWSALDGQSTLLYRGGLLLCGLAVMTVIAATRADHGVLRSALAWRPLVWAGLVSYGLYLWHWPVFTILDADRLGLDGGVLLAVQLAITVAITVASYRLLEQPIRHGALTGRRAHVVLGTSTACVLALIVGAAALTTARSGPSGGELAATLGAGATTDVGGPGGTTPGTGADGEPATPAVDPLVAVTEQLGRPPRLLVVGDSVGFTLAKGLIDYQDQLGLEVESEAVIACGVARGSGRVRLPDGTVATEAPECHEWPRHWSDAISRFDPDLVLVVVGWPASTDRDMDGTWRHPCDPVFDTWYEGEVRAALDVLRSTGTPVAMTNAAYWRSPKAPDFSDAGVDCLNEIYARVAAEDDGVQLIDLLGYVCPEAPACRETVDGVLLRDDGLHFNGPAGTLVGMWVARQGLSGLLADQPADSVGSGSDGG